MLPFIKWVATFATKEIVDFSFNNNMRERAIKHAGWPLWNSRTFLTFFQEWSGSTKEIFFLRLNKCDNTKKFRTNNFSNSFSSFSPHVWNFLGSFEEYIFISMRSSGHLEMTKRDDLTKIRIRKNVKIKNNK